MKPVIALSKVMWKKNLFVPDDFFEGSLDDFWKKVPSLDAGFEARRKVLEAENKHWRFVARLENGKASVGLQEVGVNHPFYGLGRQQQYYLADNRAL